MDFNKKNNYTISRNSCSEDIFNGNEDIFVTLKNGKQYVATFFTYKNVENIRKKNQKTGEELNGKYFWSSDMILIEDLRIDTINSVIDHLLEQDYFFDIFSEV
ncbi:hypothetical protein [Kordia jejudonensis]|uniref:hypothetical protein n=1 Tax=Kordia jejudonensis TaxID=1348245 RepID=UPI00062948D8|nr:hypothetical protein [Kordia jejudonensis]